MDLLDQRRERHVAERFMVSVDFSVGRGMYQRLSVGFLDLQQACVQGVRITQDMPEADALRQSGMIEKRGYLSARLSREPIRLAVRSRFSTKAPPYALRGFDLFHLPWGQDDEPDSRFRQQVHDRFVDRGLRQPHAFGGSSESVRKVLDAPEYLEFCIPRLVQGEYRMVEALSHGVSMTEAVLALFVRLDDLFMDVRVVLLNP